MFEKHSCNMNPKESIIRFLLAGLILVISLYTSYYILLILSLILYFTAYKKFCFIYYIFKINEKLSRKNYYLTLLPKYNLSEVFIFNKNGDILFQNDASKKTLEKIDSLSDLDIDKNILLKQKDIQTTFLYKKNYKTYKVEASFIKTENIILAYFTDVSEIVELNNAIEETQRDVIYAMGEIGESRSKETGNHVKRVALYCELLAKLYGLSDKEAELLKTASPMHDIGKVGIADNILNAPRKLTKDEFEIMKTHALLGYDMLKNSSKPILKAASIVAHEHHEKYDGSGYPDGKSAKEIHIYGRITAVADVFDALGSHRVYKDAWELEKILELFKNESGKHFDPKLVDIFLNNLDKFLIIRDKYQDL